MSYNASTSRQMAPAMNVSAAPKPDALMLSLSSASHAISALARAPSQDRLRDASAAVTSLYLAAARVARSTEERTAVAARRYALREAAAVVSQLGSGAPGVLEGMARECDAQMVRIAQGGVRRGGPRPFPRGILAIGDSPRRPGRAGAARRSSTSGITDRPSAQNAFEIADRLEQMQGAGVSMPSTPRRGGDMVPTGAAARRLRPQRKRGSVSAGACLGRQGCFGRRCG